MIDFDRASVSELNHYAREMRQKSMATAEQVAALHRQWPTAADTRPKPTMPLRAGEHGDPEEIQRGARRARAAIEIKRALAADAEDVKAQQRAAHAAFRATNSVGQLLR